MESTTGPKPFVFVLMPFDEAFDDVYQVGIRPACEAAGAYCERVDEQIFVESILERVYNQIAKADVIVSEMTDRNPNVFYETGYAHALNKQVILLTQDADDIPFDLKHFPHIVYEGKIHLLKKQLEARVRWCVENPTQSLSIADSNLRFFIEGVPLEDRPEIELLVELDDDGDQFTLPIAVHNPTNRMVEAEYLQTALVVPTGFLQRSPHGRDGASLPEGITLIRLPGVSRLFPSAWADLRTWLTVDGVLIRRFRIEGELSAEMALRVFTEVGVKEYPFTVRLVKEDRSGLWMSGN